MNELNDVLALALRLPPIERLHLVEQVVASVEREMTAEVAQTEGHWGRELNELINSLDLNDLESDEDAVEFLKQQREAEANRYQDYWDGKK